MFNPNYFQLIARESDELLYDSLVTKLKEYEEKLKEEQREPSKFDTEKRIKKVETRNPLSVQEGGDHYKKLKIQPVEYCHANNLGICEGNIIKYVTRYKDKNGKEDLKKARHFLDLLIHLEYGS